MNADWRTVGRHLVVGDWRTRVEASGGSGIWWGRDTLVLEAMHPKEVMTGLFNVWGGLGIDRNCRKKKNTINIMFVMCSSC